MHYANDRRYMGWRNFFDPRNRSYFGLQFAYDTIPNELVPFDYDTFEAYPGQVEAVVTNLQTGQAEYRPVPRRDDQLPSAPGHLRHARAVPSPSGWMTAPPIWTGAAPTPFPGSGRFDVGCDRVVVVLTRERSYRQGAGAARCPCSGGCYRKYPVFLEDHADPGGAV